MNADAKSKITTSEAAARRAYDLLEQAPDGNINRAMVEALTAIAYLRMVVRTQQQQIEELQAAAHVKIGA